jgi:pyruvate dehydrogenase E2 component (dihydrolipoamide acetyltransferase)
MATKQPADKSHFILPDLGEGVHEAELIKWRVKPGEKVAEHQTLAEMETDKALVEVPSPWAGVVKELKGNEGDIMNVGSILVTYDVSASSTQAAPERSVPAKVRETKTSAQGTLRAGPGRPATTESAEREDAGTVVGSVGGTLTIPDRFARKPLTQENGTPTGKALATPAVRRLAREAGVDISEIPPSGRGGRVTATDIHNFLETGSPALRPGRDVQTTTRAVPASLEHELPTRRAGVPPLTVETSDTRIPFRGVRRKIAEALSHSVRTAVHFTVVDEADVTALDRKRKEYAQVLGRKLSFLPFVMLAVCRALRQHPALNANVDDEAGEIINRAAINLGCAVDTDHGLMVPVIRSADKLSIVQLGDMVSDLAAQCRNRTVPRESLIGGTFTISNVGSYGGMFATPIINYPEVGILAAGRAKEQVLAKNGTIYAGLVLPLSLSCDHRVVDGAEGARFLNTVVKMLESPEQLLQGR